MANYRPSTSENEYDPAKEQLEPEEQEELLFKQDIEEAMSASLDELAHQLQLEEVIAFSDALLASELQFQEALIASSNACSSSSTPNSLSSPEIQECDEHDDNTQVGSGKRPRGGPVLVSSPKRARTAGNEVDHVVLCGICLEAKQNSEFFDREGCSHRFCNDCTAQHVLAKLQEKLIPISCPEPNCSQTLMPDQCETFLPGETLDMWHLVLVEADIPESQRFYCPYKDCSALLVKDVPEFGSSAGAVINQSECPNCRKLFCAQCVVPWHAGFECNEYQRLSPSEREQDDLKLLMLAKEKQWQRCPKCRTLVERDSGCSHMICRCSFQFCYKCGSEWKDARVPCACPGWQEDEDDI
ncbi:hypothetical protein KI387_009994 [Taxus chinensis]|uniref:RBR-type E3 ubiquitin transferase n=1 Tax=Taxus chinensis TaxID=29808 RepID=A0AA38FKC3_TAXCH|nr:hypothetical protein KI387_009994 [Taxus chinensis]